jgi:transcriptional regulator with XRE-family HTH domain
MLLQRILEEKKRLGISAKTMSERSTLHVTEETISRFLSGKTGDPGVKTFVDIAGTVGLKPYEAFMDATLAAEFNVFLELRSKSEETEAERIRIVAENESLKTTNAALTNKIAILEMQLTHKDELLAHKDELLDLYRPYRKLIPNV